VKGTRLALVLATLAVALLFIGVGRPEARGAELGLYATLAGAGLSTVLLWAALPRVRRLAPYAALQLGLDVVTVSAVVHFSGGGYSIFSFLYLPVTLYGAMLFERRGAYGAAVASSVSYGVALWAAQRFGTQDLFGGPLPDSPLFGLWFVHTGALLLVALLANALAGELRIADARLLERTVDLKLLQDLHERTVESLTSGLLTLDGEGYVTSFNPEAERITGWPSEAALGLPIEDVLPGASGLIRAAPTETSRRRSRLAYQSRRGESLHLGLAGSILRDASGDGSGHVVIFQDVTEVVRMESELRRSERLAAAGQLSADIAHEIRNPLAAISGSIEMLSRDDGRRDESQSRRLMDIVLREVTRLDELIGDFLEFARLAPPKPVAVELAALIEEVLEMFDASRPEGIEVICRVPREHEVWVDPTQLRQLIWNLVINAVQAMPEGGCLTLSSARTSGAVQGPEATDRNEMTEETAGVELVIADTGGGIEPQVLDRIFDPFFTTKRRGTGLGLATVHRIVEASGGSLHVESAVGTGTAMRVVLPSAEGDQ